VTRLRNRRVLAGLILTLSLLTVLGPLAGPAGAHSGEQSYVYLQVFDDGIEGRLEFPLRDLNRALDLDLEEDDRDQALADLAVANDEIVAYLDEHVAVRSAQGETWSITYGEWDFLDVDFGNYATVAFTVEGVPTPPPRQFEVTFDAVIEAIDDYFGLLIIETDWQGGVFNNEADFLLTYTDSRDTQQVDLDNPSFWKGFWGTVELGMEHIFIGTDHILFVLVLLLPSVLLYQAGRWQPAADFRSSFWRILKIATMFTLAHSITLTLGGLGIIEFNAKLVETVIAISIIAAAVHNIRPVYPNREYLLAFGFGIFHGLGFAGLLSDLGLDRTNRVWSLLGFNVGVEIGQIFIIALVFPTLFVLRRTRTYRWLMPAGSLACAAVAFVWMLERIFEDDYGVSRLVDPLVDAPEVFVLVAAGLVTAGALYWFDRREGELLPVVGDDRETDDELVGTT